MMKVAGAHRSVLQKELLKSVWRLSDEKVHLQMVLDC